MHADIQIVAVYTSIGNYNSAFMKYEQRQIYMQYLMCVQFVHIAMRMCDACCQMLG